MTPFQTDQLLSEVQCLFAEHACAEGTDSQLVDRFVLCRDDRAFTALLQRHGSMVLRVCRSVLGNAHDAEDAFQATFLVLACSAAKVRNKASVASFLHGTAYRVAVRARARASQRRALDQEASRMRPKAGGSEPRQDELEIVLHEELNRMPARLRQALVLCYLQGKTHAQAASELGCPVGSVSRWLRRASEVLRERLAVRGFCWPVGVLAAIPAARAAVPAALVAATLRAVGQYVVGPALVGGTSLSAVMLAKEVLGTMTSFKLKGLLALFLLAGVMAGSVALFARPGTTPGRLSAPLPGVAQLPPNKEKPARVEPVSAPTDRFGDPLPPDGLMRLGTLRWRAEGEPYSLVFSPDGKQLASAHGDKTIRLWDPATGKQRSVLRGHERRVFSVAFSPDGASLASAADDLTVRVWNIGTGQEIRRYRWDNLWPCSVAFSPDGKLLAAGGRQAIRLWDAASGKEIRRIRVPSFASVIAFAPDGKLLASVSDTQEDRQVRLWEVATGEAIGAFPGHDSSTYALAFCPDGKRLATCGDRTLRLWEVKTGKEEYRLNGKNGPRGLAFAPDGKTLASSFDGTVRLLETATGQTVRSFEEVGTHGRALAFSPDGKTLAGTPAGNGLCLWEVATGKTVSMSPGHTDSILETTFSWDGKTLLSHGRDGTYRLWDVRTGKELRVLPVHTDRLQTIALSGNHRLLATGWADGALRLENLETPAQIRIPKAHAARIDHTAISPDGKVVASTGWDRVIRLWDAESGKKQLELEDPEAGWLAFVADGKVLLSGVNTGVLTFRDANTGKVRRRWPRQPFALHPLLSDDRRRLLLRTTEGIGVWDAATGEVVGRPLKPLANSFSLAISPDGSLAASGDGDAQVRVWETTSGREHLTIAGTGVVSKLVFSPDGRFLASTADGPTVRLWEVATGREALTLTGQTGKVLHLAFSLDGRLLSSAGTDTTALVWDLTLGSRTGGIPAVTAPRELERLWADLAGEDAAAAYRATAQFAASGDRAADFLGNLLRPVEAARLRRLLLDLDSENFALREAASLGLAALGDEVEVVLRDLALKSPSAEVRRRVQLLLDDQMPASRKSGESIRLGRALQVLERIGSPGARKVLEALSGGDPAARRTREAAAALERLNRRSVDKP
jgi:RNA polymerase sigma factor (sigma-70 family)